MLYGNIIFIKKSGGDGSKFPVTERDIKIGRSENCLIRIYNPQVASEHCQLIIEDSGQATLRNLSKQTILNGKQLGLGDVALCHGDIFKLGERLARWEYLPASKYYTEVLSPTKRLVAIVMPQRRSHGAQDSPETSTAKASVLNKTPLGERKFSEKTLSEGPSASKVRKSNGVVLSHKSNNNLSKLLISRHSLKTTKLVLPVAKVKGRKSLSDIVGLKAKEKLENKSRRSTMPSWKISLSPANKKSTASRMSSKKSIRKSSKSTKSIANTPSKDLIVFENVSPSNDELKTPQETVVDTRKSKEIVKSASKNILKTPLKKALKSPSSTRKESTKSTRNIKSPSPKKSTVKTPSKLAMSTPKRRSPKNLSNLVYSESKVSAFSGKRSLFPKSTPAMKLILHKVDNNYSNKSNKKLLDLKETPKSLKKRISKDVITNEEVLTPVSNLNNLESSFGKTKSSRKSPKITSSRKTPQRKSSVKRISRSPKEVKVKTPRKSLMTKTVSPKAQKDSNTSTRVSNRMDLVSDETDLISFDDSVSSKTEKTKSVAVKSTPIKKTPKKLIKSAGKNSTPVLIEGRKSVGRRKNSSLGPATPESDTSPVQHSTSKTNKRTDTPLKKSEILSPPKPTPARGVRRKLSPSTSAERAAKKLKTSCPKKPDKNKKAALLVLGIANRNQHLSQNVKVLLKKAIKQSNAAASSRNIDRKMAIAAKLKKLPAKKVLKAKPKKPIRKKKSGGKISPTKVLQSSTESTPKSNKVVEGNQQSASKVETQVPSPKEKAESVTVSSPTKQNKKTESPRLSPTKQNKKPESPRSSPMKNSYTKSVFFDKSSEKYLFNSNRRCSKRLSSKNDTGRPDFVELSPTALGLIPKHVEVFKTPKDVKRRSSSLVTPKSVRTTGIIKSASTSKIGNRKSVRFSSKDLSFSPETPTAAEKTDFDFSSFQTPDITMDVFVSPLINETSGTKKNLTDSKVKFAGSEKAKSSTKKSTRSSSPKTYKRKILQSPQPKKSLDKISPNKKTPRTSTATATSPVENYDSKSTISNKNENQEEGNSSNVKGVRKLFATPKTRRSPKNDLSDLKGVKKLLQTPRAQRSPNNDLSDLKGVKKLLQTPRAQKSPKNDLTDVRGVKRLLKTPKEQKSPKNDLTDVRGVKKLLQTPREQNSPKNDLSDLRGVKKLLRTPKQQKSPKNDLTDVRGVKRLLKTPKEQKSPKNDLTDVRGVKKLLQTPREQKSPENNLSDLRGVKRLLQTPKQQKSPKNDLTDVRGVKRLLKTPKEQKSPKNDLSDLKGVKRLLQTPKVQKSPRNNLLDISGVGQLFKTPEKPRSPTKSSKKLEKTPEAKENLNEMLENALVNELLVSKTDKSLSKTKKTTRKLNVSNLRSVRGRPTIRPIPKGPKNDLSDLTGVRELFSRNKPINDLNVDLTGIAELFKLPSNENTSQQKAMKNVKKSRPSSVKSKTLTSRSKKQSEDENKKAKVLTRGRVRKAPEKEAKKVPAKRKKLETSTEVKTELNENTAVKRTVVKKEKTSQAKKTSVAVKEKTRSIKSRATTKTEVSESSPKQTRSVRKRKIEINEVEVTPPKQRRKTTAVEKSTSTVKRGVSKTTVSKVSSSKSGTVKKEVPAKRGRKPVAKDTPQKTAKVQLKPTPKVQNKRSQNSSKAVASSSETIESSRKTRSTKAGASKAAAASKTQSKKIEKKIVKTTAGKKKATPVVKRTTRRK